MSRGEQGALMRSSGAWLLVLGILQGCSDDTVEVQIDSSGTDHSSADTAKAIS